MLSNEKAFNTTTQLKLSSALKLERELVHLIIAHKPFA